jgi:segregation and condensation protein A
VALRARLLLPTEAEGSADARREAEGLRQRLADRAAALRLADWLERRLQLGRDVFGRGVAEPDAGSLPAADITALLRACLKLLELPARERVYRPNPPSLWRVPEALERMRRLLPGLADSAPLAHFLPPVEEGPAAALPRRAALASILLAGLELSRESALALEQHESFGEIRVNAASPGAVGAAA